MNQVGNSKIPPSGHLFFFSLPNISNEHKTRENTYNYFVRNSNLRCWELTIKLQENKTLYIFFASQMYSEYEKTRKTTLNITMQVI
jgi:hypothetical protein